MNAVIVTVIVKFSVSPFDYTYVCSLVDLNIHFHYE